MAKSLVSRKFLCLGAGLTFFGLSQGAVASALVFSGTGSVSDANAAYKRWVGSVSAFDTDTMDGLDGDTSKLTSAAGSEFNSDKSTLHDAHDYWRVLSGSNLEVRRPSGEDAVSFIWLLPEPADAFGFFGFDNDGGRITISFDDGASQPLTFTSASGSLKSDFWGISGLGTSISSVTVTIDDTGGYSKWDNFVYGESVAAVVPIPAAVWLFGSGLVGLFGLARRKGKKA